MTRGPIICPRCEAPTEPCDYTEFCTALCPWSACVNPGCDAGCMSYEERPRCRTCSAEAPCAACTTAESMEPGAACAACGKALMAARRFLEAA